MRRGEEEKEQKRRGEGEEGRKRGAYQYFDTPCLVWSCLCEQQGPPMPPRRQACMHACFHCYSKNQKKRMRPLERPSPSFFLSSFLLTISRYSHSHPSHPSHPSHLCCTYLIICKNHDSWGGVGDIAVPNALATSFYVTSCRITPRHVISRYASKSCKVYSIYQTNYYND